MREAIRLALSAGAATFPNPRVGCILQDRGQDTVQANESLGLPRDMRDYSIGAQILADLGVHKIHLLTNNPKKISGIERYGLSILRRIPLEVEPQRSNRAYLKVKKDKLGHWLSKIQ